MKRLLFLIIACAMLLTTACDIQNEKRESSDTEQSIFQSGAMIQGSTDFSQTPALALSDAQVETTRTTQNTQDTVNDTAYETTDCTTEYETHETGVGLEYVMHYTASVVTDEQKYSPYTSTVYFQNKYMVGDGILIFSSMENVLPGWIEEDVIPLVRLNEHSVVNFGCHENAAISHSGRFRLYRQDEQGNVTKVEELLNADLSAVYAFGTEHCEGETIYIHFGFLVTTGDHDDGTYAVHDVACLIKTNF